MSIRSDLIKTWTEAVRDAGMIGPLDSVEYTGPLSGAIVQAAATEYSTAMILAAAKPKMGSADVLNSLPANWKTK